MTYRENYIIYMLTAREENMANLESRPPHDLHINLLDLWMHHDNAAWRAISWVIPIEAGVIATAFARPGFLGLLSVVLGSLLILSFAMYAMKSFDDRDKNLDTIDLLKPSEVRLTDENSKRGKGSRSLIRGFLVIMLLNFFLGIIEFLRLMPWDWAKNFTEIFFKSCS